MRMKKNTSRVADENIAGDAAVVARSPSRWIGGVSFLCGIVLAPFSLLSCLSQPRINGPDGVWVSAELPQSSEVTHLMVRDSLRLDFADPKYIYAGIFISGLTYGTIGIM